MVSIFTEFFSSMEHLSPTHIHGYTFRATQLSSSDHLEIMAVLTYSTFIFLLYRLLCFFTSVIFFYPFLYFYYLNYMFFNIPLSRHPYRSFLIFIGFFFIIIMINIFLSNILGYVSFGLFCYCLYP